MVNFIPAKNGVSKYYSPWMILKRERLDYNKHLQYEFGSYVLMFQDNNFQHNNAALARGAGGIYLGFNPDSRSGHLVMDLET
eukprot:scaffold13867_cov71-Cylindrotheca_fusiformis.AAC.1